MVGVHPSVGGEHMRMTFGVVYTKSGVGKMELVTKYDIDQYYNILDIDFGITI